MDKRFMVGAILLAGALDFAANWLAAHYLVPVVPPTAADGGGAAVGLV